jgi:MoCo/4Fe-4S cofactor protein with predicted Tat translocation signal
MNETGKQYWRSLEELSNSAEFSEWMHREFPDSASILDASSRRTMLKLMAASFGLAGLTACSRPVEKILPAAKGVEDQVPGNPLYYSTAMSLGGVATGLIVESHEGRPTKVEGNPQHPASGGPCSAFAQASVLDLYDPDRSRSVMVENRQSNWDEFFAFARPHFDPARMGAGEGLRFLSQTVNSPSMEAVRAHALQRYPRARWVEYEPISRNEELAGAELAFGRRLQAHYRFDRADVVVSLDADFLGLDAPAVNYIRDYSRRRRVASEKGSMNRMYMAESQYSVTGAMADHRLRMRVSEVSGLAADLARELGVLPPSLNVLNANPRRKWVAAVARDLKRNRERSIVIAGPRQPAEVHALAHLMNHALGNTGRTVTYTESPFVPQLSALKELAGEMAAGKVATLVVLGGNPVYDAPADLNFEAAMKKVPVTIHLGGWRNETASLAKWHLPEAHYLESWGDARALDGTASIQQPLIRPLYDGKTAAELVAALTGYKDQRGYDIVRNYWLAKWPAAEAEPTWRRCLHDGVIPNTQYPLVEPKPGKAPAMSAAASQGLELAFYPSASTWDGRFANNGWLQETPEPMTKLTWDNVATLSPATARELSVATGDLITVDVQGRQIGIPAWIQPGHADGAISIALGYGRTHCGRVGDNVGHNAYRLRTSSNFHFGGGASIRKTGQKYKLASAQEHHSMEGRPLVHEATLEEYRKEPEFAGKAGHGAESFSIFGDFDYSKGNQWGMVIDLNACIGCNACAVACQAENNVPIVGKDQVARGREMHWIRLDRYYAGPEDNPEAVTQPMACQQCERAPCESVCPVGATSHSPEGLNDMAYNRCVGTRYCSNNCPFKVRRFNFLDYHKGLTEVGKMAFNPDVTVRMRGVMEKCTYCVQRIEEKKIQAKNEGRRAIRDGEITPACAQTCPAEAIVFGNINDPDSRVAELKKRNRNYTLLDQLNLKPRTSYLTKLRNPNPELA